MRRAVIWQLNGPLFRLTFGLECDIIDNILKFLLPHWTGGKQSSRSVAAEGSSGKSDLPGLRLFDLRLFLLEGRRRITLWE